MSVRGSAAVAILCRPVLDVLRGLELCAAAGSRQLLLAFMGLVLGWWIYVPVHELLHAAACELGGGRVSRLEIPAIYGGGLLASVFPFVVSGTEYAGRLSGFDTGGSDLVYLATDLGPFLLTLFPGVWLLRWGAATGRGWLFGSALPFALAPFLSLTGDAYEIGSIVVTRLGPWSVSPLRESLRGDDLFQVLAEVRSGTYPTPWGGLVLALALGVAWSLATYLAGAGVATLLGRNAVGRGLRT